MPSRAGYLFRFLVRTTRSTARDGLKVLAGFFFTIFRRERFGIRRGYCHRSGPLAFDDTATRDEWQAEVYEHAAAIAGRHGYTSVLDIGCGSAFKLMKHFRHCRTLGVDVADTCGFLRERYPDRDWMDADSFRLCDAEADLVICADVIEHIENPDDFMENLARANWKCLVMSTPDRLLWYGASTLDLGPPSNPHHYREWTGHEFRAWVQRFFEVESHQVTNYHQATQMLVCRPRRAAPVPQPTAS